MDELIDQPRPGVWLGPIFAGVVILAALFTQQPAERFQLNSDEGINLIKAALLADGYALYRDIWSDQPAAFTWMLRGWFAAFGENVTAARVLVMLFSALLAGVFCDTLRRTLGPAAAIVGTVMLILSKRYLLLSAAVMIGQPALALAVLSIWLIFVHRDHPQRWLLLLSAAAFALSVQTKAFTVFLAPLIALQSPLIARIGVPWRRRWLAACLWCAAFALVSALLLYATGALAPAQLVTAHIGSATRNAYGQGFGFDVLILELRQHDPYLVLAAVGAAWALFARRYDLFLPLLWCAAAALLMTQHRPVWFHHSMLVMIPLCWLAAFTVSGAVQWLKASPWQRAAGGAVLIFALYAVGAQAVSRAHDMREVRGGGGRAAIQALQDTAVQHGNDWVLTDQPMYAFRAGLRVPPELAVISDKRVQSGALPDELLIATLDKYRPAQLLLGRFQFSDPVRDAIAERYDRAGVYRPTTHYVRKP